METRTPDKLRNFFVAECITLLLVAACALAIVVLAVSIPTIFFYAG